MCKKLTLQEIKERLLKINPNIAILGEFEKETGKTKRRIKRFIKCKCLIDGYEWSPTLDSLMSGFGCPECGRIHVTLTEIKERLSKTNPNIEILGEFYEKTSETQKYISRYAKCKCKIDGYVWNVIWEHLLKGKGCPKCAGHIKPTLDEIKDKILNINSNIEVLNQFEKEVGITKKRIKTFINCKCKIDGYIWNTSLNSLFSGSGCPKCAGNIKLTLEDVKEKLLKINPNIKVLSDKYINGTSKLKCRCLIDGYIWGITWNDLRRGQGCPKCYRRNNFGENNPSWKGGITPLYNHLRSVAILKWKQDSFEKYNYKCDITGAHNTELTIHHLYNFSDIIQETMNTLNIPIYQEINKYADKELRLIESTCLKLHYKHGLGVCISEKEHKLFHSIYGRKNNTIKQYMKFKQMRLEQLNKDKIKAS